MVSSVGTLDRDRGGSLDRNSGQSYQADTGCNDGAHDQSLLFIRAIIAKIVLDVRCVARVLI